MKRETRIKLYKNISVPKLYSSGMHWDLFVIDWYLCFLVKLFTIHQTEGSSIYVNALRNPPIDKSSDRR